MASSLEEKDPWEQLQGLKALTFETGSVHQAQVDQIRLWGRVAFQFIPKDGYEVKIDTENQEVHYVLKGGKLFEKWNWFRTQSNRRDFQWLVGIIAGLDRSIHSLLGDDWRMTVTHNGNLEYDGPRLKTREQMKYERDEYRKQRNRDRG